MGDYDQPCQSIATLAELQENAYVPARNATEGRTAPACACVVLQHGVRHDRTSDTRDNA